MQITIRSIKLAMLGLGTSGVLAVAGCGGTAHQAASGTTSQSSSAPAQTTPAQTTPAQTTPAQTTPAQTTPAAKPSSSAIPQNNGGDQDSDNNGGPSDGDGNI
jgi:DMSO/TMAO reductase YedYZ molybdopterin-dependent catalytic subunit